MTPIEGAAPLSPRPGVPPWGDQWGVLTVLNFFVGGTALWAMAAACIAAMMTEYDGIVTMIGMVVVPVLLAVPSALTALVVGLPVRLIPVARRWWLAHGEVTVIGTAAGFVVLLVGVCVIAASGPGSSTPGMPILLVGWGLFCLSVIHVVWPRRWRRPVAFDAPGSPLATTRSRPRCGHHSANRPDRCRQPSTTTHPPTTASSTSAGRKPCIRTAPQCPLYCHPSPRSTSTRAKRGCLTGQMLLAELEGGLGEDGPVQELTLEFDERASLGH